MLQVAFQPGPHWGRVVPPMSPEHNGGTELDPVSYEALAANNRHTHANLTFCIEQCEELRLDLSLALELMTERMRERFHAIKRERDAAGS